MRFVSTALVMMAIALMLLALMLLTPTVRANPMTFVANHAGATTPPAPAAAQLAAATPRSLAFPDILPFPLLSRHRLSADLLALLYLQAVDEHAEVLADRNQRPMLVVHLHAQRAIGAL
jgi:hypothetical protein